MCLAEAVLEHPPRALIDLRSPGEFAQDHPPGALNVPLFDDLERALIGTLYARSSPRAAFEEGERRVLARIGDFTAEVARHVGWELPGIDLRSRVEGLTRLGIEGLEQGLAPTPARPRPDSVVFYCWRGGLRSRSVIGLLRGLGLDDALGIEGGYRAYRAVVRRRIGEWAAPPSFVLRGLTGVGKTLVLRELERLRPGWVLDLEGLAGHRSSILGMVGLEPATQKRFESRLAARLGRGFDGPCVVEGESRKVGDLVLPEPVWRAVDEGIGLELTTTRERRIQTLIEDYLGRAENRLELAQRLPFIEARLGAAWQGELVGLLSAGREQELVGLLLERYYDPLYRHSEGKRAYAASFDSTDAAAAAREILDWIEARQSAPSPFSTACKALPGAEEASARRPGL